MTCLRATFGLCAILLASACGQPATQPTDATGPEAQGQPPAGQAGPPPAEGGQAPPSATVSKPSELIQGEWTLALTATQQRQYELLKLAFRDPPPTEQELAELQLGPEEQLMIGMLLMGREQHPDDQATPQVTRSLEELATATLTITADTMTFAHGEDRDLASYTVISEETSALQIETTTTAEGRPVVEKVNVLMDGSDHLQLWTEADPTGARQTFARRQTEAVAAPPAPAGEGTPPGDKPTPDGAERPGAKPTPAKPTP